MTGVLWAGVHGIASLWIQEALPIATNTNDLDKFLSVLPIDLCGLPTSTPAPTGADESERQRFAGEIAAQIVAGHGSVVRWTAELADVEDWRRAARRARRLLGVRVRTGVSDDG